MNLNVQKAIQLFWKTRSGGDGVRSGKTLDEFINIIKGIVENSGMKSFKILSSTSESQLPGYFRPHKAWDVVVLSNDKLVAAIEFKSQIGSIGNNFNNRTEEVLGSGIDLYTAIQENAFENSSEIFKGFIILVEDSAKTRSPTRITMTHFPVMRGFLNDEGKRDGEYVRNKQGLYPQAQGLSYLERYELLCKRLVVQNLYTAAALIAIDDQFSEEGQYTDLSPQTSIETFLTKLANHCNLLASYGY